MSDTRRKARKPGLVVRVHVTIEYAALDGDRLADTYTTRPTPISAAEWGDRELPVQVIDELSPDRQQITKSHIEWLTEADFLARILNQDTPAPDDTEPQPKPQRQRAKK